MSQRAIPAVFMRGGTSKGLFFHARDLPAERTAWEPLLLAALGSPDPNGRQLDGMGGGISSLSKAVVVAPSERADADVDYTFAQVSVDAPVVDYGSNCGNLTAAVGPFAVDEGLVGTADGGDGEAVLRLHNRNTGKLVRARFPLRGGRARVAGDCVLDGVAGSAAPIALAFEAPGGAVTGRLLPSGRARDVLHVTGGGPIEASLVDATTACVLVRAGALGLTGTEMPDALEADGALMVRLEAIRRAAAVAIGLRPERPSVPKLALVAPPQESAILSGATLGACAVDLTARAISMGRPHRALPLTVAMCLAVAAAIPGTLAAEVARAGMGRTVRLGHPSGVVPLDATPECVTVMRTARRLMEGRVLIPR